MALPVAHVPVAHMSAARLPWRLAVVNRDKRMDCPDECACILGAFRNASLRGRRAVAPAGRMPPQQPPRQQKRTKVELVASDSTEPYVLPELNFPLT